MEKQWTPKNALQFWSAARSGLLIPSFWNGIPLRTMYVRFYSYETQGRSVLEALISDLNSRGHSKLTLREDGDICIEQGEDAVSQEHLNNFPQKVYWPRLAEVLESNGLAAEVTAQGIQVSW